MAKYVGGDLTEIVCNHPTLGDFRFSPKSNESFTIDPGGIRTADDDGNVTASGELIQVMNRKAWSVEGPIACDFDSGNEVEGLSSLMESDELASWTFTLISGTVYRGKGKPAGDLKPDTGNAQMTLKVIGGGKLQKI